MRQEKELEETVWYRMELWGPDVHQRCPTHVYRHTGLGCHSLTHFLALPTEAWEQVQPNTPTMSRLANSPVLWTPGSLGNGHSYTWGLDNQEQGGMSHCDRVRSA